MIKQLLTFNYENRWLFALKFALVTAPLNWLTVPVLIYFVVDPEYGCCSSDIKFLISLFNTAFFVSFALVLCRYQSKLKLVWRDYILRGVLTTIPVVILSGLTKPFFIEGNGWMPHLIMGAFFGVVSSIFAGIYLDRTSGAIKFKRTMSVILFVWFLFNLVTGGDSEPEEASDHVALDTDGDGIKDTIAMDTNKDGLIDSVASDTTGDGKIDTVILDSNHDGWADVTLRDHDGDGRPDGLA